MTCGEDEVVWARARAGLSRVLRKETWGNRILVYKEARDGFLKTVKVFSLVDKQAECVRGAECSRN